MKNAFRLIFLILILSACATSEEETSVLLGSPDDEKFDPEGCEPQKCSGVKNPTFCIATGFDGKILTGMKILQAWGTNPCVAKNALIAKACARKYSPKKIERLSCMPDPSEGECPPSMDKCPDLSSANQVHCRSNEYGGQVLKNGLYGIGLGDCEAKVRVKMHACQLHLKPSAVGRIVCEPSQVDGTCPPSIKACDKIYSPHICSAKIDQQKEISAFGSNRCLAEAELATRACSLNFSPHKLSDVVCKLDQ